MILSLDISTSCIGLAIFDIDEKLMSLNYVKLKGDSLFTKYDEFVSFMEENQFHKFLIKEVIIEEPLKAFKGKFTNAETIQKLSQINAMISLWCYKNYETEPVYYNVQTARKNLKVNLTLNVDVYLILDFVVISVMLLGTIYTEKKWKLNL